MNGAASRLAASSRDSVASEFAHHRFEKKDSRERKGQTRSRKQQDDRQVLGKTTWLDQKLNHQADRETDGCGKCTPIPGVERQETDRPDHQTDDRAAELNDKDCQDEMSNRPEATPEFCLLHFGLPLKMW